MLRRRRRAARTAEPTSEQGDDFGEVPLRRGDGVTPIEVHVVDDQSDVTVDPERWSALVSGVLEAEAVHGPGEAPVVFVEAEPMAALNQLHMGKQGPTDVLSFPIDAGEITAGIDHRLVGDVVVCPSVAAANAPAHAGTTDDEIALLLVHGTLHLLGYDHMEDDERARMWQRERELLDELYGPLARDPWAAA